MSEGKFGWKVRHEETVEVPSPVDPSKTTTTTHRTELPSGVEPEYVEQETVREADRVDVAASTVRRTPKGTLGELEKDFYLFTLGPIYVGTRVQFDLLLQFAEDLRMPPPDPILYRSESKLFEGLGDWSYVVEGISKDYGDLFEKYITQAVFPNPSVKPAQYWRVAQYRCRLFEPGKIGDDAMVTVFSPTGVDCKYVPVPTTAGTYTFVRDDPDTDVVNESVRYFQTLGD